MGGKNLVPTFVMTKVTENAIPSSKDHSHKATHRVHRTGSTKLKNFKIFIIMQPSKLEGHIKFKFGTDGPHSMHHWLCHSEAYILTELTWKMANSTTFKHDENIKPIN